MGEGAPVGGLRVLQSQHSCEQGDWLLDVSRAGQSDAADVSGKYAADVLVPRLSSQSGAEPAGKERYLQYGLEARPGAGGKGQAAGGAIQYPRGAGTDQLFDVSSL